MVNITTPISIISASLSRTGTMSTKLALERLGHKVWHVGVELIHGDKKWMRLYEDLANADLREDEMDRKAANREIVVEMSKDGYTAAVDAPAAYIYEDLLDYYPKAKVLNTKRDRSSWARTMAKDAFSIDVIVANNAPLRFMIGDSMTGYFGDWSKIKGLGVALDDIYPEGLKFDDSGVLSSLSLETLETSYDCYQERVRSTVPAKKLVEYSPEDGWGPLCKAFLGLARNVQPMNRFLA